MAARHTEGISQAEEDPILNSEALFINSSSMMDQETGALKVGWAQAKLAGGSQLEIFDQGLERAIETPAPRAVIIPKVRRVQSAPRFLEELKDLQRIYRRQEPKWVLNKSLLERGKLKKSPGEV
ncbi:hypothetical protein NDU88_007124 [Pleurodeles waltl]|uniref:Uncharacterized protein n=1 Tax=Pleurodeles waltl TaxID=8319 RepID=A0AAV7TZI1_PLEWA|nr:hypothetical protein NDU88_007124 [Pleurodeles waltl]